jgi:hypothetical protein
MNLRAVLELLRTCASQSAKQADYSRVAIYARMLLCDTGLCCNPRTPISTGTKFCKCARDNDEKANFKIGR